MLGLKPSKGPRESEKKGKQGRGLMDAMQSALKSIFTNPVFIPNIAVTSLAFHAVTSLTLHGDSLSSQTGSVGAMVFCFVLFQT